MAQTDSLLMRGYSMLGIGYLIKCMEKEFCRISRAGTKANLHQATKRARAYWHLMMGSFLEANLLIIRSSRAS